jgi:hypothetical protein
MPQSWVGRFVVMSVDGRISAFANTDVDGPCPQLRSLITLVIITIPACGSQSPAALPTIAATLELLGVVQRGIDGGDELLRFRLETSRK